MKNLQPGSKIKQRVVPFMLLKWKFPNILGSIVYFLYAHPLRSSLILSLNFKA